MSYMGFRQGEVMGVQDSRGRCNSCICDRLRSLQTGTTVDLFLGCGVVFEDVTFVAFNGDTCCAFFNENGSTLVLDCSKVQAMRVVNCCNGNGNG